MLTPERIKSLIESDYNSEKKRFARIAQRYYEGKHAIRGHKIYYFDKDGNLHEDTTRWNIRISHPFFKILVEQSVQFTLSGHGAFVKSDNPELQEWLDIYFNENEDFRAELYEILIGQEVNGEAYAFAYKNQDGRTGFQYADSDGVVEVRKNETDDGCEYVIYWYVDRIGQDNKKIKRIEVWDSKQTTFFCQVDDGPIVLDTNEKDNPRPHVIYKKDGDEERYYEDYGLIPFFRIDNNRKRISSLKNVKEPIDDYDLMNCGLSNNIQDAGETLYVVRGFDGDDLDELAFNIRNKKMLGLPGDEQTDAGVDIKTIDIPVEARKTKMEIDEQNIFRFGMGVNPHELKDSSATTSVAIKAAYTLLDLKANKTEIRLKQFLRKLLKIVLDEINREHETDYQQSDVYFDFEREMITNALENAQIALAEAQARNMEISTLLNIRTLLDNETLMQLVCEQLDIDYEEIKDKLPDPEEDDLYAPAAAKTTLEGVTPEDEGPDAGGDVIE